MYSKELQRVTDDDGRMEPSRGKRGTKDGAARCQDRGNETSAIGMNKGLCLGKWRRCVANRGSRTVKSKQGIPKDVCSRAGQAVQEGLPRDEAATSVITEETEAESTDTDVREAMYLFERVRGVEWSTKRAMWLRKGRATSTREIDEEVRRMVVPNRGSGRGKTSVEKEHAV